MVVYFNLLIITSGHFCPAGTALALPCPIGTLGQVTRAQSDTACVPCPPGLYCSIPGASEPQGQLALIHFSPLVDKDILAFFIQTILAHEWNYPNVILDFSFPHALGQCQQGYFCQSGSAYPAPLNTSSITRNGPCPQGHFCPSGTLTPLPCPAGTIRNLTGV